MKKLFATLLLSIFLTTFTPTTTFATSPEPTPSLHLQTVQSWLIQEDNAGINYLNNSMKAAMEKALTWSDSARLQEFSFTFDEKGKPSCYFIFSIVNIQDQVGKISCPPFEDQTQSTPLTEEASSEKTSGIYSLTLRLRDLLPLILKDSKALTLINQILAGEKGFHISSTYKLKKNSQGKTTWEVTLKNTDTGKTIILKVSGMQKDPEILVFKKK